MKKEIFSKILICIVITAFVFVSFSGYAQDNEIYKANYQLANKFTTEKIRNYLYDTFVGANWLKNSDKFWYRFKTGEGTNFYIVDPAKKTRNFIFDNDDMAAKLTELHKKPYDAKHIPITTIKFVKDNKAIQFAIDSLKYEYHLDRRTLVFVDSVKKKPRRKTWVSFSPDSSLIVFARNHNLFMIKADDPDSIETQLTTDGERWFSYARSDDDTTKTEKKRAGIRWFRDSKKFYLVRQDRRKIKDLFVINSVSKPRPKLETYKYSMPGEKNVAQDKLYIFNAEKNTHVIAKADKYADQSIGGVYMGRGGIFAGKKSDKLYFARRNRTWKKIDLCVADTETGEVEVLVEEESNPYFNTRYLQLHILNEGKDLIWWSDRDGWGHFYLYDEKGNLKNKVTSGPYLCSNIAKIDTAARILYFSAYGKEKDIDPYYSYYYRVGFDGKGLKLLTPEHGTHQIRISESAKYFVDNYSRIDLEPYSVLKDVSGNKILDLEKADISRLLEAGWKNPETFKIKAADGVTDLYGVMWKPFDFNSERKYPIITYVYPGPQTEAVPKSFSAINSNVGLAQLGFVVVVFGNRGGSPQRSAWYHTYGYGNLRDYGLADKKAGIEQLANRHAFIDIDRVGIYGHSGGGFMSTAALLVYPNFFKVAVSSAGNHDNNIYNIWWSEVHHGVEEVKVKKKKSKKENDKKGIPEDEEEYETKFKIRIPTNVDLAKNLKGHLLLVHGDIDNNVHPANTIRMVDALIKANKKFDFMLLPGIRHPFRKYNRYFTRLRWDYFVEHLLYDYRINVDIFEDEK